ncbi:HlyD family secretion protein [Calditrichota bacterium LG25]
MKTSMTCLLLLASLFIACSRDKKPFAYNGRMDTDVIRLVAKTAGTIDTLSFKEGDFVKKGRLLVKVNDRRLRLRLKQQQAQLDELNVNLQAIESRQRQLQSQLNFNQQTLAKTRAMLKQGAATPQQIDQLQTEVDILGARLEEIMTNKKLIASKRRQLQAAIDITRLNIEDSRITAPINGLVINRFVNLYESVAPGSPLLELADLSVLKATIYVPLTKLNRLKLGQKAKIKIDGTDETFEGKITWIASEAEFTPKTILTEETRTSLVYAVQIEVPNPGQKLKIGMPVEVYLEKE